ncbi:MAG: SpoIIE family protein phosphatase [Pyrinomonadaceae bacterium]
MNKKFLPFIPLALLFAFAAAAMTIHFANLPKIFRLSERQINLPFVYDGEITFLRPEAEGSGLQIGDRLMAINGRAIESNEIYFEEILKLRPDQNYTLTVARKDPDGRTETRDITLTGIKLERNFSFYSRNIVSIVFTYLLPTFCILLGFWVVFVRPRDYLAWLLLFLLLGVSTIGLEGYSSNTLVGAYRNLLFSTWALAMLLFGIYFPERWSVDERFPWAKWIFIVPLVFQVLRTLLVGAKMFLNINAIDYLKPVSEAYNLIANPLNLMAIGLFFAALSHKAATLKNPDARRRIRLMAIGTSVSMVPSFLLVIYRLVTDAKGSFFEIVPFWFALMALLLLLLFPLTLAYVIVVHRAMDVGVVIRQGLQYALAQNGVKILQFALLILVILGTYLLISGGNNPAVQIGFIVGGLALLPLIDYAAKNLRVWIDRRFFREAYNAEQILSDLSEQLRTMVETKPLLETLSAKISESLHVPQVALLLKNGGDFLPAHTLGYETPPPVVLDENGKTVEKLRQNDSLIIYKDDSESWVNEEINAEEREKLLRLNSSLLLPVTAKKELSGLLSLSAKLSDEPFTSNDLRLLKSVASQAGLALENSRLTEAIAREAAQKERLNRELEIAREVQERLFPQELPPVEGLDYFGACRPALGVGGDYYDFLELTDGKLGIAIGDISGKGIGASLMMAGLQASLRGQAIHFKDDLAGLMAQINHLLYEASTSNRYATFFYAQFDPETRRLTYVNAGHNPPFLLRRKDGEPEGIEVLTLAEGGAVVGMLPPMLVNYSQGEIELCEGDLIVGSTDGITEAMNPAEEEWGEEAVLEELKKIYGKPAEEILGHIMEKADEFAAGAKQHDDMTIIVVRVLSSDG